MNSTDDKFDPTLENFLEAHGVDPAMAAPIRRFLQLPFDESEGMEDGTEATAIVDTSNVGTASRPDARSRRRTGAIPEQAAEVEERLVREALLAVGGMGEIHRSHDVTLNRRLALKILHDRYKSDDVMRSRFQEEAQVTAQLSHPGIPPVHESGLLSDGRPYFAMKEVHGRTLASILKNFYGNVSGPATRSGLGSGLGTRPRSTSSTEKELAVAVGASEIEWSHWRLLEVYQKICEAVAYAHARGVLHCDLKPDNIMVGAFGEVMVMDWGVALIVDPSGNISTGEPPVELIIEQATDASIVGGTPAYMAPEQAVAEFDRIGPHSDVFSLGVILYELVSGKRPFKGNRVELVQRALQGDIAPMPRRETTFHDEALMDIITQALAPNEGDRYRDATELALEVARWREGALRRDKALGLVFSASELLPRARRQDRKAGKLRKLAATAIRSAGPDATLAEKIEAWGYEDEAVALSSEASLIRVEATQLLQAALAHAPDLVEAKRLLARIHHERHSAAERDRRWDEAEQYEVLLRAHDVGEYADYLRGEARLEVMARERCRVDLYRYELEGRVLTPVHVRDLGETPIASKRLPIGSYLLMLECPDGGQIRYPVVLQRERDWFSRSPSDTRARPVPLHLRQGLDDDECFVVEGWFQAGGDASAGMAGPLEWRWLESFAIQTNPITVAEFAEFLASNAGAAWRSQTLQDGLAALAPDWPAVGMNLEAARAYASWRSHEDDLPWRLPTEWEWEKAARGVDGRHFPWGDFIDPAFAEIRSDQRIPLHPAPITSHPLDTSPYGARHMSGNVREWCESAPEDIVDGCGVVRGGAWTQPADAARCAARAMVNCMRGAPDIGLRLVRTLNL